MIQSSYKTFLIVLLMGSQPKSFLDESLAEMRELVQSASGKVVGTLCARVPHPSPSHFLRHGKLTELTELAKKAGAQRLCFNVDLTPVQARNIEKEVRIKPMDRTGLILEIFAKRAQSREGKLQVELARLNYTLPRLGGLGQVMSRLGGGIGTRGPGEQELEWDRRKIRNRIQRVKEELRHVSRHRNILRLSRKKKKYISIALVGYTNAGKSTLHNALTGSQTYVEDKLFATLDPKTRLQTVNGRQDLLFVDTVGFIRDLPHTLVEAFHATLEEVVEADILIHVMDVSHEHCLKQKKAVDRVLAEIGAAGKPCVLALNKADLLTDERRRIIEQEWSQGIMISAKQKQGLRGLMSKTENLIDELQPGRST